VTDGTTVVPRHVRANGDGFEGFFGRGHIYDPVTCSRRFMSGGVASVSPASSWVAHSFTRP
jgi:hypothetical protein